MTDQVAPEAPSAQIDEMSVRQRRAASNTFYLFLWIMFGVSFIYGVRLYFNSPVHPSFLPIVAGVFSAAISFMLVMCFQITSGKIDLELFTVKLRGASGPIAIWCFCFFTICLGLNMCGFSDAVKADYKLHDNRSVLRLLFEGEAGNWKEQESFITIPPDEKKN